jgi:Zn ribbon nucleic-acid-binding protein
MADTLQTVTWALERPCGLRRNENWSDPDVTWSELSHARGYAVASKEGRVYGDVCITTTRFGNGIDLELPVRGFTISKTLAPLGGVSGIRVACDACEANVSHDDKRGVVGCHGSVHVPPASPELEARIVEAIERTGAGAEMANAFVETSPRWYGFWINSPISPQSARLLHQVLVAGDIASMARDGEAFVLGLHAAAEHSLPMQVNFHPPGHLDLGIYTAFPHCPRCKAEADLPRWRGAYPLEKRECRVCGRRFSPAETASSQPDKIMLPPGDELVAELGEDRWSAFAHSYLTARGHSGEEITRAISRYFELERR